MRELDRNLLALMLGGACAALPACTIPPSTRAESGFQLSFAGGSQDSAGRFLGGTEVRFLTAHGGKLYAGNGYWEDRPGAEGPQSSQILVLDGSSARWRVDHSFGELRISDKRVRVR